MLNHKYLSICKYLCILFMFFAMLTHCMGSPLLLDMRQQTIRIAPAQPYTIENKNKLDPVKEFLHGTSLSLEGATQTEQQVAHHPRDLTLHLQLLGYYFMHRVDNPLARERRRIHLSWIIRNYPDADFAGMAFCNVIPEIENATYLDVKRLWLEQVRKHPTSVAVLSNAAKCLREADPGLSQALINRALATEPNSPKVLLEKALEFYLNIPNVFGKERQSLATKALETYNSAFTFTQDEEMKTELLSEMAQVAFESAQFGLARTYGQQLLARGVSRRHDRNFGDAIYMGNIILGRLALRIGDIEKAKSYLLEAGQSPAVGVIVFFGPNMILAKELLDSRERGCVLTFFKMCARLWKDSGQILEKWTSEVEKGFTPDFIPYIYPTNRQDTSKFK